MVELYLILELHFPVSIAPKEMEAHKSALELLGQQFLGLVHLGSRDCFDIRIEGSHFPE
jgi:hypothetical protein